MSSTMKPVMSQGSKTPPISSQMSKQIHPQGIPTTYAQPLSHMPQNLINVPHNSNVHSNTHSITHHAVHSISHAAANHYSLNVPNTPQHYPISGNPPISSHSSTHSHSTTQAMSLSYGNPSKTPMYEPNYQGAQGHQFEKNPNLPSVQNNSMPQNPNVASQQSEPESSPAEKVHSNGTSESNVPKESKPNYTQSPIKDKPALSTQITEKSPEKKEEIAESATAPQEKEKPQQLPVTSTSSVSSLEQKVELNLVKPDESSNSSSVGSNESEPMEKPVSVNSSDVPESTSSIIETISSTPTSSEPMETASPQQLPSESEVKKDELKESSSDASPKNATAVKEQLQPSPPSNQKASTLKLATTARTPVRKPKPKTESVETPKSSEKKNDKSPTHRSPGSITKAKRNRIRTQHYQSPLPEVELISKMTSSSTPRSKSSEDRLIIFYKNEFLAVRNAEGSFYVCQAVQNIYKSSPKIRIRWLSQDKNDKSGEIYTPDFYDYTDFDCILTNLNLERVEKGKFRLPAKEKDRTDNILKRALAVEKGDTKVSSLTEEHPDGLDLSLYKEESQLKKRRPTKRKASSPLKSTPSKSPSAKKSPEKPKVRKSSPIPKKLASKASVEKRAASADTKKAIVSRAERAKRRQQEVKSTTSSSVSSSSSKAAAPVVDSKKAKVLAKVARKKVPVTVPASKITKTIGKTLKPATSKGQKPLLKQQPQQQLIQSKLQQVRKSKRGKK